MDADVVVVGGGLAGLVATAELVNRGRRVLLLEQEPATNLGGQAFWSFGGLFLVDSPEQRRLGIRDGHDLAMQDWLGSAGFDRGVDEPGGEDFWARQWATAYLAFAAGEKRAWLHAMGVRWFPVVGWAERGGGLADGHGNSVPRFHVTWGTGPGLLAPFERRVRAGIERGLVELRFRHRVDGLSVTDGVVDGVHGAVLEPSVAARGVASSRVEVGDFAVRGAGGDRHGRWDRRQPGAGPRELAGPARAGAAGDDLRGARARGRPDARHHRGGRRPGGQPRPDVALHRGHPELGPIWARHGIRILPGPSALWFDARGRRLPAPHFPGFDTLAALAAITGDRLRPLLVRAQPDDHREGVRAVGLRAEPGPDRQGHPGHAGPDPAGRAGAGGGVQGPAAPTSWSPTPWPSWSRA